MLNSIKIDNVEKPKDWKQYSVIKCVKFYLVNIT